MGNDNKKDYEELAKKHSLPKFDELDREFQISDLEESGFLLSEIREKILERIRNYTDFLSKVLQPDTDLSGMYESRVYSESQKKEVFEVYRRLMVWRRAAFAAGIKADEKAHAWFISGFWSEWGSIKPKMLGVVEELRKSWETDSEETEKLGYFG